MMLGTDSFSMKPIMDGTQKNKSNLQETEQNSHMIFQQLKENVILKLKLIQSIKNAQV